MIRRPPRSTRTDTLFPHTTLFPSNANRLTRFHLDLAHIRIPSFNLVRFMEIEKARYNEDWQRILIQLATSVVSEIFVSDYLHQLSECHDIQPMNRATVAAHRHDELAHSKIFTLLAEAFYPALSANERSEEHTSELQSLMRISYA